uniref:Uncharacterized protein n=1 Tax=Biomphalaria glabrata TaxID=6526 RepID=A0A2C9KZR4_BIOGL
MNTIEDTEEADVLRDLNDTHETEEFENDDEDAARKFENCSKNPGHDTFITLETFSQDHLPESHRSKVLYDCVKALAQMTVKISVKLVSSGRPRYHNSREYPYGKRHGSKIVRNGSGRIDFLAWHRDEKDLCPCSMCQESTSPSKTWMEIRVMTAKHVVFDDQEAKKASCKLFYDDAGSPEVVVSGFGVYYEDMEKDRCLFKCATCEESLMQTLNANMDHFVQIWEKAHNKYKHHQAKRKLICIVSHPHGHYKRVTVGHLDRARRSGQLYRQFFYSTPTCPGTSGAAVFVIGHSENLFYQHIHSGSDGLNFSGLAW